MMDILPNELLKGKFPFLIIIFVLYQFIVSSAYGAECYQTLTQEVEMPTRNVTVIVNYFCDDYAWGNRTIDKTAEILLLIVDITGAPYLHSFPINITEVPAKIDGLEGYNYWERGIRIFRNTTMDFTLVHEISHYWTPFSVQWATEGFADLMAFLVYQSMNRTGDAEAWYWSHFKELYNKKHLDFPLAEWENEYSISNETLRDYAYAKSFIFFTEIYSDIDDKTFRDLCKYHSTYGKKLNSIEFKEFLKKHIDKNMDFYFSGWAYTGDYFRENKLTTFNQILTGYMEKLSQKWQLANKTLEEGYDYYNSGKYELAKDKFLDAHHKFYEVQDGEKMNEAIEMYYKAKDLIKNKESRPPPKKGVCGPITIIFFSLAPLKLVSHLKWI